MRRGPNRARRVLALYDSLPRAENAPAKQRKSRMAARNASSVGGAARVSEGETNSSLLWGGQSGAARHRSQAAFG